VVTIIDIHQLNLGPFGTLKFLAKNSLKICVFFIFFNNESKTFYVFEEKSNTKSKKKRFYSWALHYFFTAALSTPVSSPPEFTINASSRNR
jgi:hypothetical protein